LSRGLACAACRPISFLRQSGPASCARCGRMRSGRLHCAHVVRTGVVCPSSWPSLTRGLHGGELTNYVLNIRVWAPVCVHACTVVVTVRRWHDGTGIACGLGDLAWWGPSRTAGQLESCEKGSKGTRRRRPGTGKEHDVRA
jgi:hypothetical protein